MSIGPPARRGAGRWTRLLCAVLLGAPVHGISHEALGASSTGGSLRGGGIGPEKATPSAWRGSLPGAALAHLGSASGLTSEVDFVATGSASTAAAWTGAQIVHTEKDAAEPWTIHHFFGFVVFASFVAVICAIVSIVKSQEAFFEQNIKGGTESFESYLSYRFTDWFTSSKFAPGLVLLFLTLGLIVTGAILYALLVGGSPSHALWRIFVWSTASPAEAETTGLGRLLGVMVTVCGLIILSLLLGIVTELFGSHMSDIKNGTSRVIEGGHTVVLGFTECTRCLLEELGKAAESEGGGVLVILAKESRDYVEPQVTDDSMDLRGSKVIVRSGNPCVIRDLHKVAVSSAKGIVILADTSLAPEQADAKSLRQLLALKTKRWPAQGRITVQCCVEANRRVFESIYPEKEVTVVVVGDIVANLMAQSSHQSGLASVFGMMLGFDGDEFYSQEWPELTGKTFREAVFRFPDAVALGVITAAGECNLNPGWDYTLADGDELVVLAEDNDTYSPSEEPWYRTSEQPAPPLQVTSPSSASRSLKKTRPQRILIIGWNSKVGPLLAALDGALPKGSTATIYASRPVADRESDLVKFALQSGRQFQAFTIQHLHVEDARFPCRLELERLDHSNFESIFVLADGDCSRAEADERTMAVLAQLDYLNEMSEDGERHFDPVVEMGEDSTAEHLKVCGYHNFVHSNSLVSQALAAVAEEPSVNTIYHDLMSGLTNVFEFRRYEDFLFEDENLPVELSFWEAAYHVSCRAEASVVAWTLPDPPEAGPGNATSQKQPCKKEFEMNPKDKTTRRPWKSDDRLVIIRSLK